MFIEILHQILGLLVTLPRSNGITPDTSICNRKAWWEFPSFGVSDLSLDGAALGRDSGSHDTVYVKKEDEYGLYYAIYSVTRATLDATFLRSSKVMSTLGNILLLSKNTFVFDALLPQRRPLQFLDGTIFQPPASKPAVNADFPAKIARSILNIKKQITFNFLAGWIYNDRFLYWLHKIGPKKAALVKSLKFCGSVQRKVCRTGDKECQACGNDFVHHLLVYIPVIKSLCPGLENLSLSVWDQTVGDGQPPVASSMVQLMQPILEHQICDIKSLRKLEVTSYAPSDPGAEVEEDPLKVCAANSIDWINNRTLHRDQRKGAVQEWHCESCGENHIWADCHNLCNMCGEYGHFRCSGEDWEKWQDIRWFWEFWNGISAQT